MKPTDLSIIDYYSLESPFATEFRRILHRLKRVGADELKALMVTSATLSEGKSTVSALLSITAAKKGYKTLLIDSDLRRPTIHKLFNINREPGLDEVLVDGLPAKNAIRKTPLAQLDLITAGKATAEPAETFDAVAIGRLVAEMKFYYDMIIIDCAPIIPVSDPMLLAPEVDASIIVVRAGQTPKEVVTRAVDIMRSNESARMLGIVLNNVNNHLPHYYNDRYNGYYYAPAEPDKRATRRARETRSDKKSNPGKGKSDESDTLPGAATSADKRISG